MKRLLFIIISSLMFCIPAGAQDGNIIYIIDGTMVENFDGSQLVGKKVERYNVEHPNANTTVHNIFTSDSRPAAERNEETAAGSVKGRASDDNNPLIVLNGEIYTGDVNKINPNDIAYIDVYKPGSNVAASYGVKGEHGVIKIFSKKSASAITYFIDGAKSSIDVFNKLTPQEIKAIKILKRGTSQAIELCDEGRTNDIYLITTVK